MADATPGDEALPEYVRALLSPDAYPAPPPRRASSCGRRTSPTSSSRATWPTRRRSRSTSDSSTKSRRSAARRSATPRCGSTAASRPTSTSASARSCAMARRPHRGARGGARDPPGGAEVVEWSVQMRRLPDDRTLRALLPAGEAPPGIAERVSAPTHRLPRGRRSGRERPGLRGRGGRGRAGGRASTARPRASSAARGRREDAAATRAFIDSQLEGEAALFDARLAAGRVIEGHGDLRADHVYVLDDAAHEIAIVDCIEFSEWYHFRYLDAGYDVAFLAMDLEALGYPGLGDEIAGRYIAASGDETMGVLQHRCTARSARSCAARSSRSARTRRRWARHSAPPSPPRRRASSGSRRATGSSAPTRRWW